MLSSKLAGIGCVALGACLVFSGLLYIADLFTGPVRFVEAYSAVALLAGFVTMVIGVKVLRRNDY